MTMARYSQERKEAILSKLLPPHNKTVMEVASEESISAKTLYTWCDKAKKEGKPVPGKKVSSENWSSEAKVAVVVETAALSESELSQYCREKGLYPEQVHSWTGACLNGFASSDTNQQATRQQGKVDKAKIKSLEKDLRRKEKALAETAALLVLRKKLNAFWGGRKRGELTSLPERQHLIDLIQEACSGGARLPPAWKVAELSLRTYRRWYCDGKVCADKRPEAIHPEPQNKLSEAERKAVVAKCNEPEYASLPPSQIVPSLLDLGIYLALESSFYRILNAQNQLNHS